MIANLKLLLIAIELLFVTFSYAQKPVLVIHGGAGNISKSHIPDSLAVKYKAKLSEALRAGYAVLERGGTSLEAVRTAINIMENSPLFNAGKGAVFTNKGTNEMDASIMDGATLNAGAVAGVMHIKNPINAAIEVMLHSPHVLLSGEGAETFARAQGLEMVDASYFYTEKRYRQLKKAQERESETQGYISPWLNDFKFGTVGAVALDKQGNIVAGTSTGGMTNKRFGRIGDSPIIGAGTYANNNTCGVSATGHGEYFIRSVAAHDISALMEYKGLSLREAADEVINKKLKEMGGSGGVIGLDKNGNITMTFNTNGMFRGYIKQKGDPQVFIFK